MNEFSVAFLIINIALILMLPRQRAFIPLLVGSCYMTLAQAIEVGPFHFTVIRILVAAGIVRVVLRGERIAGQMNGLDRLMLVWSIWALISSVFHKDPSAALETRLGLVYNACGIYFLIRVFCQSLDEVQRLCRVTAILLVPVAIAMLFEKVTAHNLFSALGGVSKISSLREGSIRAQGPFAHPILAGTVGAVCLPLVIGLWQQYRKAAVAGVVVCSSMIFVCASSGPIMSALAGIGALLMWRFRQQMRLALWLGILGYIGLDLVMKAPAYYIIGRFDLAGGSTGWHRAALIDSALKHLNEWWLGGTDYTRHWMPTGVSWSPDHTDITNHYLFMGVVGGLPLMLLFIATLAKGFSFIAQMIRHEADLPPESRFFVWAIGASLFAHTVTAIGVSYFDQSFLFLYLTLAAVSSVWGDRISTETRKKLEST